MAGLSLSFWDRTVESQSKNFRPHWKVSVSSWKIWFKVAFLCNCLHVRSSSFVLLYYSSSCCGLLVMLSYCKVHSLELIIYQFLLLNRIWSNFAFLTFFNYGGWMFFLFFVLGHFFKLFLTLNRDYLRRLLYLSQPIAR